MKHTIIATKRHDVGRGASRRLRNQELVPGILYGKDFEPISLQIPHKELLRCIKDKSFVSHLVDLECEGSKHTVLVKDLQMHAYKNKVMHIDFQNITADQQVQAQIPLEFINVDKCVGVKKGGALSISIKTVNVRCKAVAIPEKIEVDVHNLDVETVLHLSDIVWPQDVHSYDLLLGKEHDLPVVSVHVPKADNEASAEAAS